MMFQFSPLVLVWTVLCATSAPSAQAFAPSQLHRPLSHFSTSSSSLSATASVTLPNPFKKLPWNVKKDREREARRMKVERAKLHRQLGIAEDATYEEIVEATDRLILAAGNDIRSKIQVEVAKDQILQIRLNERMAGMQAESKEARAMSTYEVEGLDEDDLPKAAIEWNMPAWTQRLIVKPDRQLVIEQVRLWGIITALGAALPPVQDYLGRFTWLICIAQLTFRGTPKQDRDGGGMGMSFSGGGGGGHRKVAFALGFGTWIIGAILAYGMMPAWARGQRWTNSVAFGLQNLIFGLASCYLQPYKG